MLLFTILIPNIFSIHLEMFGKWRPSSVEDETRSFFDIFNPILSNFTNQSKVQASLGDLANILSYSLATGYFQPDASRYSNLSGNTHLRNWGVLLKVPPIKISLDQLQWKFFTILNQLQTSAEKLNFLQEFILRFPKYAGIISQTNVRPGIIDQYYKILEQYKIETPHLNSHQPNSDRILSLINGRVCFPDQLSISHCMIEESKAYTVFRNLKVPYRLYYKVAESPTFYPVWIRSSMPPPFSALLSDAVEHGYKGIKQINVNSSNIDTFLNIPKPLVSIRMFLYLDDPETLPMLDQAFELEKKSSHFSCSIFLIADPSNSTQRKIAHGFYNILYSASKRGSVTFLSDGLRGIDWAHAYSASNPDIPWKKIGTNATKKFDDQIQEMFNFAQKQGITRSSVSINNHFINKRPAFPSIMYEAYRCAKLLQQTMKVQLNQTELDQDIEKWLDDHSVQISRVNPPIKLHPTNLFIISKLSVKDLETISIEIASSSFPSENSDFYSNTIFENENGYINKWTFKQPVLAIGFNPNDTAIPYILHPSSSLQKLVQRFKKPLIIGGFIIDFDKLENVHETIEYVAKYSHEMFGHNLNDINLVGTVFSLIWRSDQKFNRIERRAMPERNCMQIGTTATHPLIWHIEFSPFEKSATQIVEAISLVVKHDAAVIKYFPILDLNSPTSLPYHLNYEYMSCNENGIIETPYEIVKILKPFTWSVVRENDTHMFLTGILGFGYVIPDNVESITFNNLSRKIEDHFFLLCDSISLPDEINNLYFNSLLVIEPSNNVHEIKRKLSVYTTNGPFSNMTMRSFKAHCKSNLSYFIFTNDVVNRSDLDIMVFPFFMPHIPLERLQINYIWPTIKFLVPDLIPGVGERVVILDDNVLWRKDTKFAEMNLDGAIFSAGELSDNPKEKIWNERKMRVRRLERPYLNTAVVLIDINRWNNAKMSKISWHLFKSFLIQSSWVHPDQLLSELQLYGQGITLPTNFVFRRGESKENKEKNYVAVQIGDEDTQQLFFHEIQKFL